MKNTHQPKPREDELAELEEKLATQESLANLGLAWATLQHRLNNIVPTITPQIRRLKKRIGHDDQVIWESLDILDRNVKHLVEILNRFDLLIPRETKLEPQDVNTLVYDTSQELMTTLRSDITKAVTTHYQLREDVPTIKTDAGLLKEVFRNLIENSLKALGSDGGKLDISTRHLSETAEVEVEIADTGCGIPANIQNRLFLRPIKSSSASGAGLGLWLNRLILNRLGGTIRVAHTQVGGGTTIVVTLRELA